MVLKKNLNITNLLLPLLHILSVPNEKYSSETKTSPPSQNRGVDISTVQKKTTHSLQVKGLYHRAGTDHLKWLKIKNQLQKWLKRTIVTAEGGGSGNMLAKRNFENLCSK